MNHAVDVYASVHDGEADETGNREDHCLFPPISQRPQSQLLFLLFHFCSFLSLPKKLPSILKVLLIWDFDNAISVVEKMNHGHFCASSILPFSAYLAIMAVHETTSFFGHSLKNFGCIIYSPCFAYIVTRTFPN